jgi:hypothetical protein
MIFIAIFPHQHGDELNYDKERINYPVYEESIVETTHE